MSPSFSTPTPVISLRDFGWRHAGRARPALHGLSCDIFPGERVLLLGTSGAGKSTLLAALAGVYGPTSGVDPEDGEYLGHITVRERVGLVLQDPDAQAVAARVGDDVAFGLENMAVPREEIWPRVEEALRTVGLSPELGLHDSTQTLSGGQKQRLALAGVLAMRPGIVALDEPTANIDPESIPGLVRATLDAVESTGATLLVVEHRLEPWLPHIDRIIVLGEGGIRADGPREDVLARHADALRDEGIWVPGPPPELPVARTADRARPTTAEPLLEARGLDVGWTPDHPVRRAIDLRIEAGQGVCITGHNGAGKSTLALTLGGLLPPLGGEVRAGKSLCAGLRSPHPHQWRSRELAARIGTVFQHPEHQFLCRTVREELAFGGTPEERVEELLDRLRLRHVAAASPFALSGGEKRRLSVGTALGGAHGPSLLILDEPTFGQDRRTFAELVCLLRELSEEGTAVVAVTHDPLVVGALGDEEVRL